MEKNTGNINGYATGDVNGSRTAGGLVGYNTDYGTVIGYATGNVFSSPDTGGLIGINDGTNTTTYGYWDVASSGQMNSAGNEIGISSIYSVVRIESIYGSEARYNDIESDSLVFDQIQFKEKFELPEQNAKWPILKTSVIGEEFYQGKRASIPK